MNWLLVLVVVIIGLCGWLGYRKGLVKVLFSLLAAVISLVLVGLVSPIVAQFLRDNTSFPSYIKEKSSVMAAEWNEGQEAENPLYWSEAIDSSEIPEFLKSYFKTEQTEEELEQEFNDYISNKAAELAVEAAAFVISFTVIVVVLHLVVLILNTVMKLPLLHSINRVGGLVAGLGEGLLAVWVFFLVITLLCATEFGKSCMQMIEEGKLLSFLYNTNPLMRFLI